jgi:hypothetical protein
MPGLSVVPAPRVDPPTSAAPTRPLTLYELDMAAEPRTIEVATPKQIDEEGRYLAHLESQVVLSKVEIERLKKRQAEFVAEIERAEGELLGAILHQQPDGRGRFAPLEGKTSRFAAQRNPPSVSVSDEAAVPASCKTITVTLPQLVWEAALDALDLEARRQVEDATKRDCSVVKALVKDAIAAAVPGWKKELDQKPSVYCDAVPGAAIAAGEFRLVRS